MTNIHKCHLHSTWHQQWWLDWKPKDLPSGCSLTWLMSRSRPSVEGSAVALSWGLTSSLCGPPPGSLAEWWLHPKRECLKKTGNEDDSSLKTDLETELFSTCATDQAVTEPVFKGRPRVSMKRMSKNLGITQEELNKYLLIFLKCHNSHLTYEDAEI